MAKVKAKKQQAPVSQVLAEDAQVKQPKQRKCKECGVTDVPRVNSRDQVSCISCGHRFPSED